LSDDISYSLPQLNDEGLDTIPTDAADLLDTTIHPSIKTITYGTLDTNKLEAWSEKAVGKPRPYQEQVESRFKELLNHLLRKHVMQDENYDGTMDDFEVGKDENIDDAARKKWKDYKANEEVDEGNEIIGDWITVAAQAKEEEWNSDDEKNMDMMWEQEETDSWLEYYEIEYEYVAFQDLTNCTQ
jgi:hypothetical protein